MSCFWLHNQTSAIIIEINANYYLLCKILKENSIKKHLQKS
jgi:hypothetical protein